MGLNTQIKRVKQRKRGKKGETNDRNPVKKERQVERGVGQAKQLQTASFKCRNLKKKKKKNLSVF